MKVKNFDLMTYEEMLVVQGLGKRLSLPVSITIDQGSGSWNRLVDGRRLDEQHLRSGTENEPQTLSLDKTGISKQLQDV